MLPYLDVIKNEEEQTSSIIVPNVIGMNIQEAKKILKEAGLQYEIQANNETNLAENSVIIDQLPKQGIIIQEGTKIVLYLDKETEPLP